MDVIEKCRPRKQPTMTRTLPSWFGAALAAAINLLLALHCVAQGGLDRPSTPSSQSSPSQSARAPLADAGHAAEAELQTGIALSRRGLFRDAISHFLAARGRVSDEYAVNFYLFLCFVCTPH